MSAVVPFVFEDTLFRALDRAGEPWFVAGDVARILGHRDAEKLTRLLDSDEKGTHSVGTLGGPQDVAIISEPGLYRAIAQRRASSKLAPHLRELISRFQRWLFHEVLPTLRRTGRYAMPGVEAAGPVLGEAGPTREREHDLEREKVAMRLWGVPAARRLWIDVGEPDFTPLAQSAARRAEAQAPPAVRLVAEAILGMVERSAFRDGWTGSATTLLAILREVAGPAASRVDWPGTAQKLGMALDRVNDLLVAHGVRVDRRHSTVRTVTIVTGLVPA